ncbi:MAG: hypothetical protein HYY91_02100 [Candidatus Omnitrophica bacterium]|nr:hypothetical protein [Candidatus Omnitrophota bacterium]
MPDRPTNCPTCNKRLSKKSWYYRNGQYACKKGCWQAAQAKAKQEQTAKHAPGEPVKEAPAKTAAPAEAAAAPKEAPKAAKAGG